MKKCILGLSTLVILCAFILGSGSAYAESPTAQGASFVKRSDGVWFWPLPQKYYKSFSDWAGCPGEGNCPFHNEKHKGMADGYHTKNLPLGHNGFDVGTGGVKCDVYAAASGTAYVRKGSDGRGWYIVIEHTLGNGWSYYSYYQHLSAFSVGNKTKVSAGQKIGKVGNTGGKYGIHLHFGMVLGKSGYGINAPNKLEKKGWVLSPGLKEGRILVNPATNSPAGKPGGNAASGVKMHAGSVMFTFSTSQVSVSDPSQPQVDKGRWHVFTNVEIQAYQTVGGSSSVHTYPANQGIIITGFYPEGSKKSGNPTWYKTEDDLYIKASALSVKPAEAPTKIDGTEPKPTSVHVIVNPIYNNYALQSEPYDSDFVMKRVNKSDELKVKAIWCNKHGNYWLETDDGLFILAKHVKLNTKKTPEIVFKMGSDYKGPNKNGTSNYASGTTSIGLHGTISGNAPITKVTAGWYYHILGLDVPAVPTCVIKDLNSTSFAVDKAYKDSSGKTQASVNDSLNAKTLMANIRDVTGVSAGKEKGTFIYKINVYYRAYADVLADNENPLQEITSPVTVIAYPFTVGGGDSAENIEDILGAKPVTSITLDKSSLTIPITGNAYGTCYLSATVNPSDASNKKLIWSSSNASVATVADGKVTAVAPGTAVITATADDGSGKQAQCTVTVQRMADSVSISSTSQTLYVNGTSTTKLTAMVLPSNVSNSGVTWFSSNSGIVSVDQSGNITANAVGTATITAKANDASGKQGTCQVIVRAYVDTVTLSGNSSVNVGESIKLTPTISPINAEHKAVTWTSSDTSVATVDSNGNVRGVKAGYTVTITATAIDRGTKSGVFSIVVTQPVTEIDISGSSSVLKGSTVTLSTVIQPTNASNKTISWSSDNTFIATVNNGVVTGVSAGYTTIWASATDGSGVKTPYSIHVLQPVTAITISGDTIVPVDGSISLSAAIAPANADNPSLSWSVSPSTIANVTSQGVVTGLRPGSAAVTASATDGSGVSKDYSIQVVQQVVAVKIEGDSLVHTGCTAQLTALVTSDENLSDTSVTWSSSDPSIATVNSSGVVTGIGNGTAVITATSNAESYYSAKHRVTVDTLVSNITVSGTAAVDAGNTAQLSAAVTPLTASNKALAWSSSNEAIAVVNGNGTVSGIAEGTVTITATAMDGSGVSGTIEVTVYPLPSSVTISGESALLVDTAAQFSATVLPANARNKNVTWASSDTNVATVNANGLVTATGNGTAVITATAVGNAMIIAQHEVAVTTLVSAVTLDAPDRIDVGEMGTVTATILPSTASNKQLHWTSSDEEIAVVDASGNVFGISGGYVTITATTVDGSEIAANIDIQIFQNVQSIFVDVDPIAYIGQIVPLSTIILPEDASNTYVTWTSSNDNIVCIEEFESESDYGLRAVCMQSGVAKLTATATDGSDVSGYAYIQVYPYTELTRNFVVYNIYTTGETNSRIGRVSLTADSSSRAAEDKHGAVWTIEHYSGDYAAALGINERSYTYSGFTLTNSVDLMLLGVNHTGSDTYRVTCTINGQADTCLVTVNVVEPAAPLPDSVSLSTTTYSAEVGEEIAMDIIPVVSPANAALPSDANPFLYGVDSFNRYAQVSMGENVFNVTFSKAGVYTAYVRYEGTNYQYDAYVTFVITTPEGTVPPPIESLSINNSMMYLLPGETAKYDLQISPANADESTLVWSSSDPSVVSVSADGTMTAVSTGTSVITVSAGNGITATGFVAVTDSLLSIDWNPNDIIEVYVGGESRTVIQKVYLTARASAQLTEAPEWTIKRQYGNNLTLTCEPVTTTNGSGQLLYGCAIILKSVSAVGTTEYELTCSDGVNSASTIIQVNANSIEDTLPSLLQWNNTVFTGTVNQRMAIYPVVQCWPNGTALPDEVTISIDGDSYWNTALKTSDYTISRGMITFAFNEPGVYTANVVYSCSNMRYLVPITVRVADSSGNVPVRLMQVTLNETEISMKAGDAAQLYTAFSPSDATNKAVTWSSDNPSVATVSANGLITAVANGKTNITCTPSDTNCTPVTCVVIVEDTFTVTQYQEMNYQYLQGDVGEPVAGFRLSNGTAKRVETEGLTPVWTLTRVSGHSADVELREYKGTQFIVVTNLIAAGTDTYQVTCTAGNYSWTGQASLEVHDLGATAPASVTLAETVYTTSIGEEVTLDFTPVCEPAGASIPSELYAEYIGIGDIYSALADPYQYSLFTAGDRFNLGFKKPGTYLLSRQYTSCNLTYVTECTIIVDDGPLNLIKCTDEDAVVYIGGQSSIASTCIIRDTSMEELYGDQIIWNAERLSGDCLTVALRADQSSASLYVVNAKEEGEEVWRVSCTFKGITDSVDITIHAVQPRTELPENASLYQTEFDGMIGNSITVPLAVECSPEGTSLPVTDDQAWSFSTDGNAKAHALWSFENNQMKIVFTESGYYGGSLIYQSGNISYRFPISFAITDEESVQAEPVNLAISLSDDSVTVYPEGETQIAIVNAVLTDSLDAYSLSSVAAYAERNHAVWSVQILSGNSCSLSISSTSAAGVQLMLDSINGSGDVTYQILCSVAGKTATVQGTVHVASSSEARPQPEMKQSYFTTPTGTVLSIDASMYDHTHTMKLCSGKDSIWDNASALAAMGYEYDTSGDLLLPVFYEPGSYVTTITNRIGNLVFNKEVIIAVYTAHSIPSSPSRLSFPAALQEIEEEAFEGLNVNIIDLRGSSVRIIGARAFADIHGLMRVYIPGSVTSISTQAFEGCTDFVICCAEGSYADTWARGLHYPVVNNME